MKQTPKPYHQRPEAARNVPPEKYARLMAEAKAPYRGLRRVIYTAVTASGLIGAFIFFTQLLAGRDVSSALPNLGIQVGVVLLMVWLFRIDRPKSEK
jgi:hypothetical protein